MRRSCYCSRLIAACAAVALATASARADLVQVDMTPYFNADVIVNGVGMARDITQDGMDGTRCFITQSAADDIGGAGADGLPDNGFFPANAQHPDVQLGYHDTNDGPNAWQAFGQGDSVMIDVPDGFYSQLFLFGSSAIDPGLSRFSEAEVKLIYTDPPPTTNGIVIRDWLRRDFLQPPPGEFFLVNGLDRVNADGTGFENRDDPAIFGQGLNPDSGRILTAVMITKIDDNEDRSINVFGLTGDARPVPEPATISLLVAVAVAATRRRATA